MAEFFKQKYPYNSFEGRRPCKYLGFDPNLTWVMKGYWVLYLHEREAPPLRPGFWIWMAPLGFGISYNLTTTKHHCTLLVLIDFLSGLGLIIYLEFCLLKLLTFYQKLLWNIRSRLNSSTFWVFEPVFRYVEAFCTQNEDFDQIYLNTGSKTQNVEMLSLDLIFYNNFW